VQEDTGITPRALLDRPEVEDGSAFWWVAWSRLNRSRQWSQGEPQSITVSECFALCAGMGWNDPDTRETLLDIVQELDEVFIAHVLQKQKAKLDKAGKPAVVTK